MSLLLSSSIHAQNLVCPSDTTIGCGVLIDPFFTGIATAENLDSLFFIDSTIQSCPNDIIIQRSWIAVRDSMNNDTCRQLITIEVDSFEFFGINDTLLIQDGCIEEFDDMILGGLDLPCNVGIDSIDLQIAEETCERIVLSVSWVFGDDCRDTSIAVTQVIIIENKVIVNLDQAEVTIDTGSANGTITLIELCEPVNPVQYLWSNGDTSSLLSEAEAGDYTLTITDVNGCEQIESFTIGSMNTDTSGMQMDTSGMTMDTSGMTMDTSGMTMDTSGMQMDTSGMTMDTSGMQMDTSGMQMDTSGMQMDTSGMQMDTSGMQMDTSGMQMDSSGMQMDTSGMQMDTSGMQMDTSGMQMDTSGMQMDTSGMQMDTSGMQMDTSGMQMDTSGMQMDTSGMQMDTSGMQMDTSGMQMDTSGMQMDTSGMQMDTSGMQMDTSGMQMDTSGMQMDTSGMQMDTSGMQMDTSGMQMDTSGMQMDTSGMQMDTSGMQMDTSGMQMDTSGMQMDTSGMQMDTSGMQMDTSGMQMDTSGMQMDTSGMQMDTSGMQMDTSGMQMEDVMLDTLGLDSIFSVTIRDREGQLMSVDSLYFLDQDSSLLTINIIEKDTGSYKFLTKSLILQAKEICLDLDDNPARDLSAQDIRTGQLIILQEIEGCVEDRISGDVNGTNTFTAADLVSMKNIILEKADSFPIGRTWRFVRSDITKTTMQLCVPITNRDKNAGEIEILGLKIGDLKCNE